MGRGQGAVEEFYSPPMFLPHPADCMGVRRLIEQPRNLARTSQSGGHRAGEIAVEERGNLGFAFDPLFYVPSEGKTFGELTTDEKNQFSHRKNSLEKFIKWYSSQE